MCIRDSMKHADLSPPAPVAERLYWAPRMSSPIRMSREPSIQSSISSGLQDSQAKVRTPKSTSTFFREPWINLTHRTMDRDGKPMEYKWAMEQLAYVWWTLHKVLYYPIIQAHCFLSSSWPQRYLICTEICETYWFRRNSYNKHHMSDLLSSTRQLRKAVTSICISFIQQEMTNIFANTTHALELSIKQIGQEYIR